MLIIILNRLNPIAEYILAEEKAGFRKKRSTIEHILNATNLYVSSLNHYIEESKHITTEKNTTVHCTVYNSLILYILLYGCETWTLTERLEKRITAFEHKAIKESWGLPTEKEKQIIMYTT